MPKAAPQSNGVDAVMNGLVAATRNGQEEAARAWSRGCELYADYFSALAKAKGPEGVLAAHADLMAGTMEAFAQSAAATQRLNGVATTAASS